MSSIYSLQVKISNDIVTQYNQKSASMYLCFALGNQLDSSPESPVLFNVIVATVGPGTKTNPQNKLIRFLNSNRYFRAVH